MTNEVHLMSNPIYGASSFESDWNARMEELDQEIDNQAFHKFYRKKLAAFMIDNGFATGLGDTFDGLLLELEGQIAELRKKS